MRSLIFMSICEVTDFRGANDLLLTLGQTRFAANDLDIKKNRCFDCYGGHVC